MSTDLVVLLDEQLRAAGTADRTAVHTAETPLHLAFSCYVFDGDGRLLLTRRALTKRTWPGVWTNSFCGHPAPGETPEDAVRRRAPQELGVAVRDVRCVLPDFRYRATDASGVVENEFCPVFVARLDDAPSPSGEEVMELTWAAWPAVVALAEQAPALLSPWSAQQIPALAAVLPIPRSTA